MVPNGLGSELTLFSISFFLESTEHDFLVCLIGHNHSSCGYESKEQNTQSHIFPHFPKKVSLETKAKGYFLPVDNQVPVIVAYPCPHVPQFTLRGSSVWPKDRGETEWVQKSRKVSVRRTQYIKYDWNLRSCMSDPWLVYEFLLLLAWQVVNTFTLKGQTLRFGPEL